jgi:hypothetical protein
MYERIEALTSDLGVIPITFWSFSTNSGPICATELACTPSTHTSMLAQLRSPECRL